MESATIFTPPSTGLSSILFSIRTIFQKAENIKISPNNTKKSKKLHRVFHRQYDIRFAGAQWLSGRVLDSRLKGRGFDIPASLCCVLEQEH